MKITTRIPIPNIHEFIRKAASQHGTGPITMARLALRLAACVVMLMGCASCAVTRSYKDPEYDSVLKRVRTDWKGDEIVGVWLTKRHWSGDPREWRDTVMFRPDGTGTARTFEPEKDPTGTEFDFRWSYTGNGVWNITSSELAVTSAWWVPITKWEYHSGFRYTGAELVHETVFSIPIGTTSVRCRQRAVSVRASDQAAVAEYLRKR